MSNTTVRVFNILLSRRDEVEFGFAGLVKRALKLGVEPITWTWGKAFSSRERVPHPVYGDEVVYHEDVSRITLTVFGSTPRLNGWAFIGALSHIEGETIIRRIGVSEVPQKYWNRGPLCDHCNQKRQRNDTFVLQHEDGRHTQVGSTCLTDFIGTDKVLKVASAASLIASACAIAESAEELSGFSDGRGSAALLPKYLPYVALETREHGWVSRGRAYDTGCKATADIALDRMLSRKEEPSEEDRARATAAIEWSEGLSDEKVQESDYLHNLRSVARMNLVDRKCLGVAASMLVAHAKTLKSGGDSTSQHFGEIDKREVFPLTLLEIRAFASDAYGTRYKYTFEDKDGNVALWWTGNREEGVTEGTLYYVKGTVSKHSEYRGTKQTVLSRCVLSTEAPKVKKTRAKKAAQAAS